MNAFPPQQNPTCRRREFLSACALAMAGAALAGPLGASVPQAPASAGPASPQWIEDLVAANRILALEGVLDGYGHVSVRHDRDPNRYLISRSRAAELVTAEDILEFDLESRPVDLRGRTTYAEIFIHGEIYKARPDVKAIVHHHSPAIIPFGASGVPLRPIYHMSAFIGQGVPVFDMRKALGQATDLLVRNAERGRALAQTLGHHPAALMRGHGAVVVGPTVPRVVGRCIYLQSNATLQMQAMALGKEITYLDPEEARAVEEEVWDVIDYLRAWELWKRKALGQ